jgi:hypothetical protein
MKRKVINVNDQLYRELITIKGFLEQQRKEHVSLEEVVAYLLQTYKEKQEAGE